MSTRAASFRVVGGRRASCVLTDWVHKYIPFESRTLQAFEEAFKFGGTAVWLYGTSLTTQALFVAVRAKA